MRYFFNIILQDDYVVDAEGVGAPSLDEAKRDALEILLEHAASRDFGEGCMFELCGIHICDAEGCILARVDAAPVLSKLMAALASAEGTCRGDGRSAPDTSGASVCSDRYLFDQYLENADILSLIARRKYRFVSLSFRSLLVTLIAYVLVLVVK